MADVIPLKVVLGSISQLAPSDQLRADGVVPRSGTVLALGDPATTTVINLGGVGTQVNVPGSMTVTTTATFNGNTIIGDAITDDLTIVAGILANLTFRADGSPHSLTMQPAAAGAQPLQIVGGASGGAGAGGPVNITGGNAPGAGAGGSVVLTGGTSTGLPGATIVSTPRSADATVLTAGPALTLTQTGTGGASVGVFAGTLDPNAASVIAPEGSLYLRDNGATGELWIKTGPATWTQASVAGASSLQTAYVAGNAISVTDAEGSIAFSSAAAATVDLLTLTTALTATGRGLFVNNLGTGDAIVVQDGGADILVIDAAGAVSITASSSGASGGKVTIESGTGLTGAGGGIGITAGNGGSGGSGGGSIDVTSGAPGANGQDVGDITLLAPTHNFLTGVAGRVIVRASNRTTGNAVAGGIVIDGGDHTGAGAGGGIQITGGDSVSSNGGALVLTGGQSTSGGFGGSLFLLAGASPTGPGGDATLQAGSGGALAGGATLVLGGTGTGTVAGGRVEIRGGLSGIGGLPGSTVIASARGAQNVATAVTGPMLQLEQTGLDGAIVSVFVGTAVPSGGTGVVANEGSLYLRDGGALGELYLKTGAANTAWSLVSTGAGATTLQDAYNNSAAPATIVATAAKAITLSNAVDATNVLNVNRTFAGLGVGINVVMGATTTGFGINVAQTVGATGAGIQVIHTTGSGINIVQNTANSGNGLTVTQGLLGLGTGIVSSHLGGLRAADFRNNNGTVGGVLIAANGTGASQALEVTADGAHTGVSIISQNSDALIVDSMAGGNIVDFRRNTVSVLTINGPGSIIATPTSGLNFTVDTLGVGTISLDSAAASNFTVSGATADLTLGARNATITLNQAGNTILVGFIATSIVGALNELKLAATPGATVVTFTTSSATAGQAVKITGPSALAAADADDGESPTIGIQLNGVTPFQVVVAGKVTGLAGLTIGARYFFSQAPGAIVTTAPTTAGTLARRVGWADTANSLVVSVGDGYIN